MEDGTAFEVTSRQVDPGEGKGHEPDPAIIALVKCLARQAAREDHERAVRRDNEATQ